MSNANPKNVLEVGAGTGHLSKDIFELGLRVTAIEPSTGMFKVAQETLMETNVAVLNISSTELNDDDLFDFSFSHLVAHVVEDLHGFFQSIHDHLLHDGQFVFSIPHPCFYNDYKEFFDDEYSYMSLLSKEVSFAITKEPSNIIGGVPYHHRPISFYFNTLIGNGFRIEAFDEIFPSREIQEKYGAMWSTPRYCTFTCRKI